VRARDAGGVRRTWHVLDTGPVAAEGTGGTLLCVHGNPTWSYLWRDLLAAAARAGWRAVAVDHLDMGFSERTGTTRLLERRIADLGAVTDALGITGGDASGPVVTVAHDWGGPISLGWARAHRERLAGVVLTNTAVHQPTGSPAPGLIRLALAPGLLRTVTVRTPAFLWGTLELAHPELPREVRSAYLAPYAGADRRKGIGRFVADIPLEPGHPSWTTLQDLAGTVGEALAEVPVLLLWGPRDPVFGDRYLRDLLTRLPHAAVHRFEGAGHLVPEDADIAGAVMTWLGDTRANRRTDQPADERAAEAAGDGGRTPAGGAAGSVARRPLWAALAERASDADAAVVEVGGHKGGQRRISWTLLARRVDELAAGLTVCGVRPGHRVALLVPPGADLTAAVYACLRIGAVIVVADAGLGLAGLHRALRGAGPDHVIAIPRALAAARVLRWPGQRIAAGTVDRTTLRALGARRTLADVARLGGATLPPPPGPDADAAILFTSGATGPAKGVVYRHRQLEAQRDALARTYDVGTGDRLVAAFAPFALYGPALGVTSVVPDMDVTAPRTLSAGALADAVAAVDATMVFASPASLGNVVATAEGLDRWQRDALGGVRLLLSAGAPVPELLLREAVALLPSARAHTPYGMTEVLPVADVTLEQIEEAGAGDGVCVGRPVEGVQVALSPLAADGRATGALTEEPGTSGEICVRAAHVKDRYDRLWLTERASTRDAGWHRSGDVGHLDGQGRLWAEGRLVHVVTTATGVVTPVGIERRVEALPSVRRAAAVGVGPVGTQQVVLVVETEPPTRRAGLAPLLLADAVRAAVDVGAHGEHGAHGAQAAGSGATGGEVAGAGLTGAGATGAGVAAVVVVPALPVDVRHNSKIDRTRVARWVSAALSGRRVGQL
jgi:acyl-CoA synthetase (AMP-forming)/AMP-acid ligase II/pimeloyl-ACP methyl ester carboxylesterase